MGILRVNQISGDETQLSTLGIGTTTPVTGSVFFDGDGDYLTLATSGDFNYGTGDFTWEMWVYVNSFSGNRYVLDHDSNSGTISNGGGGATKLGYYNSSVALSTLETTGFGQLSTNTWYHLAAVRKNGITSLYTNGVLTASASDSYNYGTPALNIGRYGSGGNEFNGYISNLRILKGTALYTANFTPPTLILEPIQDTVLLCCNNPDSAAAVSLAGIGTSKTITVNGNAVASTFNPGLVRNFTSGTQFSGVTRLDTQGYFVPPSGTTENRFPNFAGADAASARGVFAGGTSPGTTYNVIDYITISTLGNAADFGDLTQAKESPGSCASSVRGIFGGGSVTPTIINAIDFITISSTGNAADFGDLTSVKATSAGCSSSTRGIFAGGETPTVLNVIEYITIASSGNAADFGDLISTYNRTKASFASPTRGVFGGGQDGSSTKSNIIEFITIASTGNAVDFGDLISNVAYIEGCSNQIRGLFGGGETPSYTNVIQYITISALGNAVDFGDLQNPKSVPGSCASTLRGIWAGGATPTAINTIDYVTILTTGNAQDFGDLTFGRYYNKGLSNGHGGLG